MTTGNGAVRRHLPLPDSRRAANMKAFQDARALREEGGHMCAQGAHYLKTALSEVGALPRVY